VSGVTADEPGRDGGATTAEESTATAAADQGLLERIDAFPWPFGLAAGWVAFVLGYLVVTAYMLVGIAPLQGSLVDRLVGVGFIFYNAHTVPIVAGAPGVVSRLPHPVANAAIPWVYYGVPVVTLTAVAGGFTYWYRPGENDTLTAVATGASMTIGYLLLALLGTFVFDQFGQLRPDRLWVLGAGLAFPLVCGTLGSIVAQSALASSEARAATGEGDETDENRRT
jgi:hypothetical protein